MQRQNMRREFITAEELMAQLREQGERVEDVKKCYLEGDGRFSIVTEKPQGGAGAGPKETIR
jgi:uncharacterized membrane protein YcaP (DUF421 family)